MSTLNISKQQENVAFLERTKSTILNNFNIISSKQIDAAVLLATYLNVMGRQDEAVKLLESFVFDVTYKPNREDLWGANGQGIVLLASIYQEYGEFEKQNNLVSIIKNNDIMSQTESKAVYLKDDLAEHQEILNHYKQETQKYRCRMLAQQILTFTYYKEMLPTFRSEVGELEVSLINKHIKESAIRLNAELTS